LLSPAASRQERIEESLVVAGRQQTAFDAELFHHPGKAEAIHQHADGAYYARLVDIYAVGSNRHVVAARSADVFHHRVQRDVGMLGAQAPDFIVDVPCLHRTATRAVDAQNHALGALVLECVLQPRHDDFGAGRAAGRDHPLQVHQGGVPAGTGVLLAEPAQTHEQQREQVNE
jgi:hypothetical protein